MITYNYNVGSRIINFFQKPNLLRENAYVTKLIIINDIILISKLVDLY